MNPAPLVILAVLGAGAAAGYATYAMDDAPYPGLNACQTHAVAAPASGNGLVRFELLNTDAPAQRMVVCLMTKDHENVAMREVFVPSGAKVDVDFQVPVGTYFALVELKSDGSLSTQEGTIVYLALCPNFAARIPHEIGNGPEGSETPDCFHPGTGAPQQDYTEMAVSLLFRGHEATRAATVGATTSATLGLAILLRAPLQFGALVLFTRLTKHKLLDNARRSRIHDAVEAQPGIHASALARELGCARGEALYHLHVMVREGVLARVGNWGLRSFFIAGRYAPKEMRARAALRSEALERVYGAIQRTRGAPLGDVARAAGFSLGRASRLARRLEEVGLVERLEKGRTVLYSPSALMGATPAMPATA